MGSLHKFVKHYCVGKEYDSCKNSPCTHSSSTGCTHPKHPFNTKKFDQHQDTKRKATCESCFWEGSPTELHSRTTDLNIDLKMGFIAPLLCNIPTCPICGSDASY